MGKVSPNPLVGCVIVDKDMRFLGVGAHEKYGAPHAEINAIANVKASHKNLDIALNGATIYVTLEPCNHTGKTPPCCDEILKYKFARVIYGANDPNPQNTSGMEKIKAAGIEVYLDEIWSEDCKKLAQVFLCNQTQKRPFVGLKTAVSLDGAIGQDGSRRVWLTGERARTYGHYLRAYYDAILIGNKTLFADNPTLDCRHPLFDRIRNKKIILDPHGKINQFADSKLPNLLAGEPELVIIVTQKDTILANSILDLGIHQWNILSSQATEKNIPRLLETCLTNGIYSVLIEGGALTYQPFLNARAVDKLHFFQAPKIIGKNQNFWVQPLQQDKGIDVTHSELTLLDGDILIEGTLV